MEPRNAPQRHGDGQDEIGEIEGSRHALGDLECGFTRRLITS